MSTATNHIRETLGTIGLAISSNFIFLMSSVKNIEFTTREKIKLRGTGSPRIVYTSGLNKLDEVKNKSTSLHYINFEIFKNGLLIRSSRDNTNLDFFLNVVEIREIHIWVKRYMTFAYFKWWMKYDGILTIKNQNSEIVFYIPQVYFKPFKKFIYKSWMKKFVIYEIDPSPPEILKFASLLGAFNRL